MNPNAEKLIVALDVPTRAEARRVFAELRETGCAFKIGLQLFAAAGAEFVTELIAQNARIFLDLKFHDIPNTVAAASVEAARLGVWMFNVHAAGGREMMERTANAVRELSARENTPSPKIIAVTVLTSSNQETLRETGVDAEPLTQVLRLANLARDSGLDGVVASAHEARRISAECRTRSAKSLEQKEFVIVTPGIRFDSALEGDDQKRTLTARAAIENGADCIVVGRPILTANDKIEVVNRILREIGQTNFRANE